MRPGHGLPLQGASRGCKYKLKSPGETGLIERGLCEGLRHGKLKAQGRRGQVKEVCVRSYVTVVNLDGQRCS